MMDGEETTVAVVDTDNDGSAEMAMVDRDGDGDADPTEEQFEALFPNLNWDNWKPIID
jgi:hypothetical protein